MNTDLITQAILNLNLSPLAMESGAALVDEWVNKWYGPDSQEKILAVECGFVLQLETFTYAIGVQDMISEDSVGVLGNEWKSTKEPGKWWNEEKWLESISTGPQLALYALALHEGGYYEKGSNQGIVFGVPEPRIRVRAAVKSQPPQFWPAFPEDGIFTFDARALESARRAFIAKAAQVRLLRELRLVPWQLPGTHCTTFNRTCEFLEKFCKVQNHPVVLEGNDKITMFDSSDPAAELALVHIPRHVLEDDRTVVLSASSYALASQCAEKYRIISGALGGKEDSMALDMGTVLHAGIAEMYRQIKEEQK